MFPQFNLTDSKAYQRWREWKLSQYPLKTSRLFTTIGEYNALSSEEVRKIRFDLRRYNFAFYRVASPEEKSSDVPVAIVSQLGLNLSDKHLCGDDIGLAEIKVKQTRAPGEYIPYTNKGINWHTDGYYNSHDKKIFSMILHCAEAAASGGSNLFFDHEMLYILLRDENPDLIRALMRPNAMTIPENRQDGVLIREEQSGPVFSVSPLGLHLRYTARTKSIQWEDNEKVKEAVEKIQELLQDGSPFAIAHRLKPGEGIISNNILHTRTEFQDSEKHARLIYRMRFYERIELE